jgi:hypothetical protein
MEPGGIPMSLWRGAEALAAALPALAGVHLLRLLHRALAPTATRPAALRPLGLAAGTALGVALLLAAPHVESFRPSRIFAAGGPWRIGLPDFLASHGLPARVTLDTALAALGEGRVLLLLAGGAFALAWWRGLADLRALGAFLLLVAGTALLLHYAAHLLAWMLALLNFWLFAIALFAFQRWRYAARRVDH